jgi:hypothetical protein
MKLVFTIITRGGAAAQVGPKYAIRLMEGSP